MCHRSVTPTLCHTFIDTHDFSGNKLCILNLIGFLVIFSRVQERAAVIQRAQLQPVELMSEEDAEMVKTGLRAMFEKHDVDGNGVLDRTEFRKCLSETELGLERRDIQALMALADANEDGGVDYEEFIELSR